MPDDNMCECVHCAWCRCRRWGSAVAHTRRRICSCKAARAARCALWRHRIPQHSAAVQCRARPHHGLLFNRLHRSLELCKVGDTSYLLCILPSQLRKQKGGTDIIAQEAAGVDRQAVCRAELLIARQDASFTFQSLHYVPSAPLVSALSDGGAAAVVVARVWQRDAGQSKWGLAHLLLLPQLLSVGPVVCAEVIPYHLTYPVRILFSCVLQV